MTNKINKICSQKNLQALVFEELDDSQASAVVGGEGEIVDGLNGLNRVLNEFLEQENKLRKRENDQSLSLI
ncbi:hypothetical protein [Nostoc sphaeroides]|uniref:Uncharacterized protein n=1 Tax=Nostoc sphaeroides CCNUC1 TaxID=2653204 RepID=A0A5P8WI41_9NOSO|nr:hypothetical protein [Nostoc sphaeroides]QFS51489.1 hypothetical protein GXM_08983 [Nostoc sphaeroides CCNUC1]